MNPTHIPADLFGAALLEGWTGPVDLSGLERGRPEEWIESASGPGGMANGYTQSRLRLNLTRPEAAWRLCVVLAAGERECLRRPVFGQRDADSPWVRQPAPAWHLLPRALGGALDDALARHSPAMLAYHATDVARGGPGLSMLVISTRGEALIDGDTLRLPALP